MKTLKKISPLFLLLTFLSAAVFGQEYDDMYFSSKDRKQVKYASEDKMVKQDLDQVQQATQNPDENFSQRNVNPEYIAKYKAASREQYDFDSEYADNDYYVEDYNTNPELGEVTSNFTNNAIPVRDRFGNVTYVRNYEDIFWTDPFLYQGTMFDPLYSPWVNRWNRGWNVSVGFGWNNWGWNRWNRGWNVGVGFGWGNGWGWNRWNNWGWNSWGWNNWGYCPPGYGWGGNTVVINNYEARNNRTFRRGPASSRRSSTVDGVSSRRRTSAIAENGNQSGRSSANSRSSVRSRNYDDAQSRYYRRSRNAVSSEGTVSGRTYNSRSSSSTYRSGTRSRSGSEYSTPSRSSSRSSGYNSRSSSRNSNFSRPSRSSRSYSSPSRSSGSRSYSSPSRSSSRSSGYNRSSRSSSSRSSGVSRSSSGSRSSGSRSSSRSSRRGGN